ncbi:hypothetical protein JX265_000808 [Neoarthrinium moseri]|uniref:Uncharacterized protein n=1 Tax=Neoarthrinium moseri TaxID=1658444 RepID=A0A9P9WWV1_9PEZI|nr:uncharacterized protein JN550_007086 [Neoarthrinium moseri]KAI1847557.1 hypothetical protein JX266_006409 [Neoarthrinium moseri]KAI1867355.1 hypothetical protein JN550_007086 [Neoarthrinium moseri]KAI1880568.1 hypothetical protein JX265_000808 [Neoarthrinium moseri]
MDQWTFVPGGTEAPGKPVTTITGPALSKSVQAEEISTAMAVRSRADEQQMGLRTNLELGHAMQSRIDRPLFSNSEREQLRLMNHYCLHVSGSISSMFTPQTPSLWTEWITGLAFENDYLLHCILSISALHMALKSAAPRDQMVIASRHHGLGITLFQPYLANPALGDYDSALTFSYCVTLYAFGIHFLYRLDTNLISTFIDIMFLIHGCRALVASSMEERRTSRWVELILAKPDVPQQLPEEVEDMLCKLLEHTASIDSQVLKGMYVSALDALRLNHAIAISYGHSLKTVATFAVMSPAGFWPRARQGEALALAILANYAVILHSYRGSIWIQGWAKAVVDAVRQALPHEWHSCISWAIAETNNSRGTAEIMALG